MAAWICGLSTLPSLGVAWKSLGSKHPPGPAPTLDVAAAYTAAPAPETSAITIAIAPRDHRIGSPRRPSAFDLIPIACIVRMRCPHRGPHRVCSQRRDDRLHGGDRHARILCGVPTSYTREGHAAGRENPRPALKASRTPRPSALRQRRCWRRTREAGPPGVHRVRPTEARTVSARM